jgi:ectoine hydroxylase-related dioxygenase (phytanoyl-CoA dioxygenase family)
MFKLVADNPALADKMMNLPHIPGAGVQGLKSDPGWMEFATHPVIVDMVEQIVGPDIILRGSAVFYKRAGNGPATPWHRDSAVLPIKPMRAMAVWIAASDTSVVNACLRFIPGSHRNQSRGAHRQDPRQGVTFGLTLDESEYDESTAVDVEVEAGQMVIFDVFTIHGSRSNLGTRERAAYAVRFMPATSHFDHDAPDDRDSGSYVPFAKRPLILLRGVDRAGNDFRRGHPGQ